MPRLRFTIGSLLLAVLFAAIALAALWASTDPWDNAIFGLTLLVLATSILLAVHRRDRRRAFWLGFALFGWLYLGASLIPPIESRLPTTEALGHLQARWPKPTQTVIFMTQGMPPAQLWVSGTPQYFIEIGHSLLGIMIADLGGHLSRFLYGPGPGDQEKLPRG